MPIICPIMRWIGTIAAGLTATALAGCVMPPPAPLAPTPLVAVPGPTKTAAQFQQDDAACRTEAAGAPAARQSQANDPSPAVPAGVVYLRCMTARQNGVEPLASAVPVSYGYYMPYPVYAGIGFGFPWFYDDFAAVHFYRGGYGGYGGYRDFGRRDLGVRDGGFRGSGFRGGRR